MRLVTDTNTHVSGFGWQGAPALVIDAVLDGHVLLITSQALLDELARVLHYPKLAHVFPEPDRIVALVRAIADPAYPTEQLTVVADDPDNRVLEAAAAGQADAIVTGDHELLALHTFRDISILTATDFLSRLADKP